MDSNKKPQPNSQQDGPSGLGAAESFHSESHARGAAAGASTEAESASSASSSLEPATSPTGQNETPLPSAPVEYISDPFQVFKHAFRGFRLNAKALILGLALGVPVSAGAVVLQASVTESPVMLTLIGYLIYYAINFFVGGLLLYMFIQSARHRKVSVGEAVDRIRRRYWVFVGAALLAALLMLLGYILFIIPGLLAAYWLFHAQPVVLDQDKGVVDSLKTSKDLVRGTLFELLGLFGAATVILVSPLLAAIPIFGLVTNSDSEAVSLVALFSLIVLGVIYLVAAGLTTQIAMVYRYTSILAIRQAGQEKPPTHWMNYALVTVPLLFLLAGAYLVLSTGQ